MQPEMNKLPYFCLDEIVELVYDKPSLSQSL